MIQTWRWFGPGDRVTLSDARQAGATGIVSALYDVPPGAVWTRAAIAARRQQIEDAGLRWEVVESLPVSEAIRTGAPEAQDHFDTWAESLENLAAEGLRVICYNFMPVLDWTRTDLSAPMPSGARALRFDLTDLALFDIHILRRAGAEGDYAAATVSAATERARDLTADRAARLTATILAGLPGAVERWTLDSFRDRLARYAGIDAAGLRTRLAAFLGAVVPQAERLDMRLCCHPDDPPWPLFGLPRILSTEADYAHMLDAVDIRANGVTLCTGSLGARPDNDLPFIATRFADRIHFVHLRNVTRDTDTVPCSFFEDEHLEGATDMVAVIAALVSEEARRREEGREDHQIPMRPDHGQEILDDLTRGAQPGYPAIGRLKGLAELRGIERTLTHGRYGLGA